MVYFYIKRSIVPVEAFSAITTGPWSRLAIFDSDSDYDYRNYSTMTPGSSSEAFFSTFLDSDSRLRLKTPTQTPLPK